MFERLDERLQEVKQQIRNKEKWQNQLADYERELDEKKKSTDEWKARLQQENHDVDQLENMSLTNFLTTIAGTKEDRLRMEKKEAAAAQLKYDEAVKARSHIELAIQEIKEKLQGYPDAEEQYEDLLNEKEMWIRESNHAEAKKLFEYSEKIADLRTRLTESKEAIQAGEIVLNALDGAIEELGSAKNWGALDMFGGGMITTAVKHDHMENAKEAVYFAQAKMREFQKELLDVGQKEEWSIDLSGLLTFADYFFDGIIADWFVQEKINDSLAQTHLQAGDVEEILKQLKKDLSTTEMNLNAIVNERNEWLEAARM
ncbi:MAG TPA: hypothetical protein VFK37_08000 [Bacillales bacterium]|nr:hypothetical protein [Bacillales bacterium]